jgi:His/Glu/Gln/Arg/opine family amino acid ABC transporter permease subunit
MLEFVTRYWDAYLIGLGVGVAISASSMAISLVIGTFTALGRLSGSPVIRAAAGTYVAVFRALPPLLVLFLVYFGIPVWAQEIQIAFVIELFEPLNNRIIAATVAIALTSGAYSTEIIRSGIESVPEEQVEAAKSIGMSGRLTFTRVIAPQAFHVAAPSLGNEYVYLLKGTSLASVIGVVELMRTAQLAAGTTFEHLLAYAMAGAYYVTLVALLQFALGKLEQRSAMHQGGAGSTLVQGHLDRRAEPVRGH